MIKLDWVLTAERMPSTGTECWIATTWRGDRGVRIASFDNDRWWICDVCDDSIPLESVTHWAPYEEPELPE